MKYDYIKILNEVEPLNEPLNKSNKVRLHYKVNRDEILAYHMQYRMRLKALKVP